MSHVSHQAGAYPGFRSMKRLGIFLLPPGWDASPSQGYPQVPPGKYNVHFENIYNSTYKIYTTYCHGTNIMSIPVLFYFHFQATIAAFAASEGHAHPRVVELPKVCSKQLPINQNLSTK